MKALLSNMWRTPYHQGAVLAASCRRHPHSGAAACSSRVVQVRHYLPGQNPSFLGVSGRVRRQRPANRQQLPDDCAQRKHQDRGRLACNVVEPATRVLDMSSQAPRPCLHDIGTQHCVGTLDSLLRCFSSFGTKSGLQMEGATFWTDDRAVDRYRPGWCRGQTGAMERFATCTSQ